MNAIRMMTLMACLTNARPLMSRLMMATAFAPSRIISTSRSMTAAALSTRLSLVPFVSRISSSHYESYSLESTTPRAQQALHSTTSSNSNDLITTNSNNFNNLDEIDPYSTQALDNLSTFYTKHNLPTDDIESVHKSLLRLTEQVLSWNQRLNLVSRKDCNAAVVYHRHVLPSVALLPLILQEEQQQSSLDDTQGDTEGSEKKKMNVIDVGTGGGFPGLPLALLLPSVQFTLVDSVQKKMVAVADMAAELDVTNVRVHWGRVEEMYADEKGRREHLGKYDVCLGRSVTALPRFCGWVSDLLKKKNSDGKWEEEGRLIYIIGGDLDDIVSSRIVRDIPLDTLLHRTEGTSDKRALIFTASDVEEIANESGEKQKIVRTGPGRKNKNKNSSNRGGGKKLAKGAWSKKQNDVKKQRGYDDFQRYEF